MVNDEEAKERARAEFKKIVEIARSIPEPTIKSNTVLAPPKTYAWIVDAVRRKDRSDRVWVGVAFAGLAIVLIGIALAAYALAPIIRSALEQ